jgi:hypothetical protein
VTDETVSSDEMRWSRSHIDPIDAVLGEDPLDEDLADVAAIVHDVRSAYLPVDPIERHPALAAFTGAPLDHGGDLLVTAGSQAREPAPPADVRTERRETIGRKRHDMLSTLSGLVTGLAGKVVLGTAVAAASVGGLHAADVVDIPVLPDTARPTVEQPATGEGGEASATATEAGTEGQRTAGAKQAAAEAYTDAVREWTDCVAATAAGQGDQATRTTEGFDPRAECGDRPQPGDFGLTELPTQAADAAREAGAGAAGHSVASDAPGATIPTDRASAPAEAPAPSGQGDAPANAPMTSIPNDRGAGEAPARTDRSAGGTDTPAGGRP